MSTSFNISSIFAQVAANVDSVLSSRATDPFSVYFDYGRYKEITRRLTEKQGGVTTRSQRFPLIWLVIPFDETYGKTDEVCELSNLQIIISCQTEVDSTTPDRMVDNFIPRLFPIYDELIRQLNISGFFTYDGMQIPHKKVNQPYWGGEDGQQTANFFNEPIDAIQLKNMQLTVNEQNCSRFKLIGA